MKRLFALIFALCLVFSGCAAQPEETAPSTTAEPTAEPTTEATTVPTEPPVVYRNPLNGAVLEAPYTGRPVAVVINNLRDCLPQYGVSQADFIYELETESGITRFLAVYSSLDGVASIGPVRSARTFFNSISVAYDAPIVHCGGSVRGRNAYTDKSGSKLSTWDHLDERYNGGYFFRDKDRFHNQGYNWEHTLFTSGEKLTKAMTDKGFTSDTQQDYGMQFAEDVTLNSFVAEKVVVSFRNNKTTSFQYNSETGLYAAEQYGGAFMDANNNQQVHFRNVIVLYTPQSFSHDGEYSRSYYELIGEGEGYLAIGGQITRIHWSRADLNSPFVYTLADGTPVTLGVGSTYVGIACTSSEPVDYE